MRRRSAQSDYNLAMPKPAPQAHLSDVLLRDLRVINTHSVLLELGTSAKAIVPVHRRPLLHLVLDGAVTFHLNKPVSQVKLHTGDSALFFYGDGHAVGNINGRNIQKIKFPDGATHRPEEPCRQRIGGAPNVAILLSSAVDLAYISPATLAIRPAPKIWPMYAAAEAGSGRALIGDPKQWRNALHGPGAMAFANMLIGLHLVHSIRDMYQKMWQDRTMDINASATRWLGAALRTIHTQPDLPWTVAKLAHEVGLSRSQFSEVFTENIGVPPLSYLTRIRMARAAELLAAGALSITDVGRRVGYPLQTSFARAFALFHGVSPKSYALRHR